MILTTEALTADEFHRATGWELKAEGACKGEVCVPLPEGAVTGGIVDVGIVADRLGMPMVSEGSELRAIGPESVGGRALATAVTPELVLPDLDGKPFELSSLRGKKVVLVAWAPY
ncbi:MAG: hypothetical protein NVS3B21_14740 [Acidimicrobiales bacterium]